MVDQISAAVLFCNTKHLIPISIGSFREFYPNMKLLVVDNSDDGICTPALKKYIQDDPHAIIFKTEKNLGHGIGADLCIRKSLGKYVYIFESDVAMLKPGLIETMLELMNSEVYGIGRLDLCTYKTTDFVDENYTGKKMMRLWIFAALMNKHQYLKFPGFDSDKGTNANPVMAAMRKIEDSGCSKSLLVHFDTEQYVRHLYGGTRLKIGIPDLPDYKNIEGKYDPVV